MEVTHQPREHSIFAAVAKLVLKTSVSANHRTVALPPNLVADSPILIYLFVNLHEETLTVMGRPTHYHVFNRLGGPVVLAGHTFDIYSDLDRRVIVVPVIEVMILGPKASRPSVAKDEFQRPDNVGLPCVV